MKNLTIDKNNFLSSMQKILKLVSDGEELEVVVKKTKKNNINKSYKKALEEYEKGEFIYGGEVNE